MEQIKGLALLHDVDTEELIKKDEETDKTDGQEIHLQTCVADTGTN